MDATVQILLTMAGYMLIVILIGLFFAKSRRQIPRIIFWADVRSARG